MQVRDSVRFIFGTLWLFREGILWQHLHFLIYSFFYHIWIFHKTLWNFCRPIFSQWKYFLTFIIKFLNRHPLRSEWHNCTYRKGRQVLSSIKKINYIKLFKGKFVNSVIQICTLLSGDSEDIKTVIVTNHDNEPVRIVHLRYFFNFLERIFNQ